MLPTLEDPKGNGHPFLHTLTPAEFPLGAQLIQLPVVSKAQGQLLAPWMVRIMQPKSWVSWQPDCNLSLSLRGWGQNRKVFFSSWRWFSSCFYSPAFEPKHRKFSQLFCEAFCKCDNLYDFNNNNFIWFFIISPIQLMIKSIKFLLNHPGRQITCSPHGTGSGHTHLTGNVYISTEW